VSPASSGFLGGCDLPDGCPYYLKSRDETTFAPFAGYFSSKEQVDRVVEAINKRGDRDKP